MIDEPSLVDFILRTATAKGVLPCAALTKGLLGETMTYEPLDDVQERIFTRFAVGSFPVPPRRFVASADAIAIAERKVADVQGADQGEAGRLPGRCWPSPKS